MRRSFPNPSSPGARLAGTGLPRLRRLVLALAAGSLLSAGPGAASLWAQTLPSGMQVVAGQAQAQLSGQLLTVSNTPGTILNWNSFSIGAGQAVRFEQANASSQVLNRVVGNDPSSILGSLSSNGRVWLLNPNGVLFGQGARVDVASLVTSSLNLNDSDWLAGRYVFSQGLGQAGAVVNEGELRGSQGGRIALIGSSVSNKGLIDAPGGQLLLAAGESVELLDTGAPHLSVRVRAPAGEALNLGQMKAAGGRIDIHAAIVNQQGLLRADALQAGPGGHIELRASERLNVTGEVSAMGGAQSVGGRLDLLGREVGLMAGARLDVSGGAGGGEVFVGGGLLGQDASLPNAEAVYFAPTAGITADALGSGDGGRIILWSDKATRAFGSLSVRGGGDGGDGGFIETSGGWLDARPARVDTAAPQGRSGQWLLDPYNITISDNTSDFSVDANFQAIGGEASISSATIENALNAGTNVFIFTGFGGSESGNIDFNNASIDVSSNNPGSLSVNAAGNISFSYSAINSSAPMSVNMQAGSSGSGAFYLTLSNISIGGSSGGAVVLSAPDTVALYSASISTPGAITLQANSIDLGSGASLSSSASGTAILLQGAGGAPLRYFNNYGGASALQAGGGRWIIYAEQPDGEGFYPGGLEHDFTRFGASPGGWLASDPGNGLVFAEQRNAVLSASVQDKVYDGSRIATLLNPQVFGDSDHTGSLDANALVRFDSPNAGGQIPVSLAPGGGQTEAIRMFDDEGRPVFGYALSYTLYGSITPRPLGASPTVLPKVYDGSSQATLVVGALSGLVAGESLNVSGLGSFSDKNVGSGKPVLASYSVQNGSNGLAANYSFSAPQSLSGDITPAPVKLSGLTALGKSYDGTVSAALSGQAQFNVLAGDQVSVLGQAQAEFSDKNAGLDKTVLITGLSLGGPDAFNYQISDMGLSADITPAPLVISGLVALDKVYDTSTVAAIGGAVSFSVFGSDQVLLAGPLTGSFADKNVGAAKPVTLDATTLSGADAGNYIAVLPSGLSAKITPAALQVSGISVLDKVYDASTQASLIGSPQFAALGSDQVTVGGAGSAVFVDKNVGQNKPVVLSGYTLSGPDAGNYSLQAAGGLSANITPAPLHIFGVTATDKVYDGSSLASLSGQAQITPLAQDQLSLGGSATAGFADAGVGSAKAVTAGGWVLAGADAGNYSLINPDGLRASITPATLRYLADPINGVSGTALPELSGSVLGFVAGETLATATSGSLLFSTPASSASPAGFYAINGGGLTAANYEFIQDPSNAGALTLVGLGPAQAQAQSATVGLDQLQQPLPAPGPITAGEPEGLLDLTAAPAPLPAPPSSPAQVRPAAPGATSVASAADSARVAAAGASFDSVPVSELSDGALAGLLLSRERYKSALFADATAKLARDPTLADVRDCASVQDAATGQCLVTEAIKRQFQQQQEVARPSAEPAVPLPLPASPAAAPPPALSAGAAVPPPPSTVPVPLSVKRRVVTASLPQIERKLAVLIGVDRYQDASIPVLANAIGDARAVSRLFESSLGYETVLIENGSKQAVIGALNKLALEVGPRDSVVIYYAGHGELVDATGLGYWQLADADAKSPESWLSNADIGRLISRIGASQVALISDSCYSGSLLSDERIRAQPGKVDASQFLQRKAAVVMSSGGNEPVADAGRQGHSPFAWNLMNTLKQVADWQVGGNVFERVRFAVARELPQRPRYGAATAAGHQSGGDYLFEQRQIEAGPVQ